MKLLGATNQKQVIASISHYDCVSAGEGADYIMCDGGQPHTLKTKIMTIAQQLNVTTFPFIIKNKNGNVIYRETSNGVIIDNPPKIDQPTYAMLAKMRDRAILAENQLAAALEEIVELNEEYETWWAQKRIAIDELKEVTERRDHWKARCLQQNKDLGYELRDPNGTIWSECKRLQSELTNANEYADKLAAGLPDGMLPKDVEVLREANLGLAVELTAVTEQRDRLAEALRECREDSVELLGERWFWDSESRRDYDKRYKVTRDNVDRADEALQSLNQPTEP